MDMPPPSAGQRPTSGNYGWAIALGLFFLLFAIARCTATSRSSAEMAVNASPAAAVVPAPASAAAPSDAVYEDVSQSQVERAFKDAQTIYARGGLSGLANAIQQCFSRLQNARNYNDLDYCIAMDGFATRQADAAFAGGTPAESYFAQTAQRDFEAAKEMLNGQSDPAARIIDTRAAEEKVLARLSPASAGDVSADDEAAPVTHRPTFNCAKVTSENLKLICAVPALADDDRQMGYAFEQALQRVADPAALLAGQRAWIKTRNNAANDLIALHAMYVERIDQLQAMN